jgi:hypothetical protein
MNHSVMTRVMWVAIRLDQITQVLSDNNLAQDRHNIDSTDISVSPSWYGLPPTFYVLSLGYLEANSSCTLYSAPRWVYCIAPFFGSLLTGAASNVYIYSLKDPVATKLKAFLEFQWQ